MDPVGSAEETQNSGIDRKRLKEILHRFLEVNRQRLDRTKEALSLHQSVIVDLLPLLFHVNHPVLPGYISQTTPAGLSNYKPDKQILRQAKQLSRSFHYQPLSSRQEPIEALYIMGSVGTIGQSRKSDLDIWVCHSYTLKKNTIIELDRKCTSISEWAKTLGLDICFFTMDAQKFKTGETTPLSEESSGSTQHGLLLDEFYRSAIYLGGRYPLWWFVPAELEQSYDHYSSELMHKRFLRESEVVDFGAPKVPLSEYVTAAIWQLYKGIHSPHKSVLKLLLLEVYASQYPNTQLLSTVFKSRVQSGCDDINQVDPYLLVFNSLEQYLLGVNAEKRLEIVRRCLYFKVDKPLSRHSSSSLAASWQHRQLQLLIDQWGWEKGYIKHLDERRQWKAQQVILERQQLVKELLNSYRFLADFVRRQGASSKHLQSEISILGKRLYAAFERKAGKIEWINPNISPDLSETYLTLLQRPQASGKGSHWSLNAIAAQKEYQSESQLKSGLSALELYVWAYCNEVLGPQTSSWLQTTDQAIYSLNNLHSALRQWLPLPLPHTNQTAFEQKPTPVSVMLVINLHHPSDLPSADGNLQLDPLNVGKGRQSLVNDTHILIHNSWNEVFVHSFANNSLELVITELLTLSLSGQQPAAPKLTVFCREGALASQIKMRVEQLFWQLIKAYQQDRVSVSPRYLVQINGTYCCWQNHGQQIRCTRLADETQLLEYLSKPQTQLNSIHLDPHTLQHHPLAAIAALPTSPSIQVAYHAHGDQAEVYILDEKGSLFTASMAFYNEASLLRPLHQFIRKAIERLDLSASINDHFGVYPIEFYSLIHDPSSHRYLAEPRHIVNDINDLNFFNIQVIIDVSYNNELYYSIYCDDQEFHQTELGDTLFKQVAAFILQQRHQGERYPCYITDLDLSHYRDRIAAEHPLQISHFLNLKRSIEAQLNHELQTL